MDFETLVARLVAEGRPSWLVYRSAPGRNRAGYLDECRDAWNLWTDAGSWWIISGRGEDRTEERFATEAEACDVLYDRVVATGETGVRAVALGELPAAAQRVVRRVGLAPEQRAGDRIVSGAEMGFRVVETPDGIRIDRMSLRPPIVGSTWFTGLSLDDAARIVMVDAADRLPAEPGLPRWGIPGWERDRAAAVLDRLAEVSPERLEQAFLGDPHGVLEIVARPAAIGFLTEALVELAEAKGYEIVPYGSDDAVELRNVGSPGHALRRRADGYHLEWKGEKSNTWDAHSVHPDLDGARAALAEALGPLRPPRPLSPTAR